VTRGNARADAAAGIRRRSGLRRPRHR
jgi:hypothetical protein